ncbi:Bro-N domain-containing protein [Cupriavidus sp. 2MCAB6]|uniref:BRO-N domain-containing protein n=1 Tax=Cupriavidus sp. 2MCAB6 TaxID=3232981 RepID=UPI003F8F2601
MSTPSIFAFDSHAVRILTGADTQPWFVGEDVCIALGYADPVNAMKQHCRGVVKHHPIPDSLGRIQAARVLSEPDMLRLIVSSNLPAAERFERWVLDDVLPAVRKAGTLHAGATVPQQLAAHRLRLRLLDKLEVERHPEKRQAIHDQLQHASTLLQLPTPAIDAIGSEAPPVPAAVPALLAALESLRTLQIAFNHAHDPRLLALNLPHLVRLCDEHRVSLPSRSELHRALPTSIAPRYVDQRVVRSAITGRLVKCWVLSV